jgi:hypothetical protein
MARRTSCEECGSRVTLDTQDGPDPLDLIGGECPNCGYYVTRYNDPAAARKAGLA